MGQVEVELDAASTAPVEESASAADDLLAQLAGDEIDRMLAEADVETQPADSPPAPVSVAQKDFEPISPEPIPEATAADVDAMLKEAGAEVVTDPAPPAAPEPAAEAERTAEPISSPPAPAEVAQAIEEPAVPAPPATPPAPAAAVAEVAPVEAAVAPVAAVVINTAKTLRFSADDPNAPLPFYVRFLELLNAPFESLSDSVRDMMGGVALVTLFNSIVLIGYVILFRHK